MNQYVHSQPIELSFIIPAHNAGKELIKCVNSIDNCKDLTKLEILVVENGSTDDTNDVANELRKRYSNVRLLHSDKGVSKARNKGISEACGEWIVFVDADDTLVSGGTDLLLDSLTDESDLILFGHEKSNGNNSVTDKTVSYSNEKITEARVEMITNPTRYMQVWAKRFNKSLIDENHIRFIEDVVVSEDSAFTLEYSKYCNSITFSDETIYHYSTNDGSTMRTFDGNKVNNYIDALKKTSVFVQDESAEIKNAFDVYVLMHLNIAGVREIFAKENTNTFREKVMYLKKICNTEPFSSAIKNIHFSQCRSFRMLPILCIKTGFYSGAGMIYLARVRQNERNHN